MNVKLYVGDSLSYDNLLPEEEKKGRNIFSLAIEEAVNKGGVATILMPRDNPTSDKFSTYNVPVTVYRDGKLRWRGRPIPPAKEDMFGRKTITCEGELCFLQDAILRPHSYSGKAADIFSRIISIYNAAVEPWKRFAVGNVTVDGNIDITLKEPKSVLEAVQNIVQQCGGYILFDSAEDGSRRINWYKHFPYSCNQTVRYGENLIDFNCQPIASDFATRIIPYGAVGDDGNRIKINVNGKDYVENAEAVAIHGIIEKAVVYNDISDPAALRAKAESDVAVLGLLPSVIQLKAIDLSRQDLALDAFAVGQQVPAESVAHGLSGSYYLTSLSEDLVNPEVGGVTLQREQASVSGGIARTLTGAIAAGSKGLLSSAKNSADLSAAGAVANQTQEYIFNKLTNNGALQGLYMLDGQLYINASYLKSGTLDASLIKTGVIQSADGAIRLDLSAGATGPIFNSGISTNGITVRGDIADVSEVFKVEAKKTERVSVPYFDMKVKSATDGNVIARLTESFTEDYSERYGVAFQLKTADDSHEVRLLTGPDVAAVMLARNGTEIGNVAIKDLTTGDPALSVWGEIVYISGDNVYISGDNVYISGRKVSWKHNGDGTFTLIGT